MRVATQRTNSRRRTWFDVRVVAVDSACVMSVAGVSGAHPLLLWQVPSDIDLETQAVPNERSCGSFAASSGRGVVVLSAQKKSSLGGGASTSSGWQASPLVRVGGFLLVLLVQLVGLRALLTTRSIEPDEYEIGYFEACPDGVCLIMDGSFRTGIFPEIELNDEDTLLVPPGRSLVLPLAADRSYVIDRADAPGAPHIVVGSQVSWEESGNPSENGSSVTRLVRGFVPSVVEGELRFREWRPASPWGEDEARLGQLAEACGTPVAVEMGATRGQPSVSVQMGDCEASAPFGMEENAEPEPSLVVLAGPRWATVRRPGNPWRTELRIHGVFLPFLILMSVVAGIAGLGWILSFTSSSLILLASFLHPLAAVLLWISAAFLGACGCFWRGIRRLWRRKPALACAAVAGPILLIIVVVINFRSSEIGPEDQPVAGDAQQDPCLLVGYSTVEGAGLRFGTDGLYELLASSCQACAGGLERRAASAKDFTWIRDVVCAAGRSQRGGGPIVFLGGNNDDFLWGMTRGSLFGNLADSLQVLKVILSPDQVQPDHWSSLMSLAEHHSFQSSGEQAEVIEETLRCSAENEATFWFIHNFMAFDLEGGRSADRTRMLEMRRAALAGTGATFVDTLERFQGEVGVHWFNDFIHLSAVGHERIAGLTCESILQDPAER